MAKKIIDIGIDLKIRYSIIFTNLEDGLPTEVPLKGNFTFNYDYEKVDEPHCWHFHVDLGVRIPRVADCLMRFTFSLDCKQQWLLAKKIVTTIIETAFNQLSKDFDGQCEKNGINWKAGSIKHNKELIDTYVETLLKMEAHREEHRKESDFFQTKQNPGFSITPGINTQRIALGTAIVMDMIFFSSNVFDHKSIVQRMAGLLPFPEYLTLKFRLMKINDGNVYLSFRQFVFFRLCIDCACQVINSKFYSLLKPELDRVGMKEDVIKYYLVHCDKFVKQTNKNLEKAGTHVTNFDKVPDWVELLVGE